MVEKRVLFTARYLERFKSFVDSACRRLILILSSNLFLKLVFLWFLVQAVYFAVTVRYGLPPDENYHYTYILLFAHHFPSPFLHDQGGYNVLIEAVRNPFFLYHYLLSFPFMLFRHLPDSYIYLRLVNVALGTGSLWLVYKIAETIKVSALIRNLSLFMLSNTLMFVFLSAAINYDNLSIFLSLASVYLLLKLWHRITARDVLLFAVTLLSGAMVKINFLPLAFILLALLLFRYRRKLPAVYASFKSTFLTYRKLNLVLVALLVFLGGLFIQRYVVNVVNYGTYAPACQTVRPITDCRKSSNFSRNELLYGIKRKAPKENLVGFAGTWGHLMEQRTYGVFSNKNFRPNKYITAWVSIIFLFSTIAIIRGWQKSDKLLSILLIISLFYLIALLFENYHDYTRSGRIMAVQGRYAFGVLPLLYLIGNHYGFKLLKGSLSRALFISITLLIFTVSSLPTYLHKSTSHWHRSSASSAVLPR